MQFRSLIAAVAAGLVTASFAIAQDRCPKQEATHLDGATQFGPMNPCSGVTYDLGGITITTPSTGCPLWVFYTPPHDLAVPSKRETMVTVATLQPISQLYFRCRQNWILILPWGSSCEFDRQLVVGHVPLLTVVPCPVEARS